MGWAGGLNHQAWARLRCEGRHQDGLQRSARALTAARSAHDLLQQGSAHSCTAWALGRLGDPAAAAGHSRESAGLFEAADDLPGALQAMPGRRCSLAGAGRHEEAVTEHLRTLVLLDRAGDRIEPHIADFGRANLRMAIGSAHTALKNWFQAADEPHSVVDLCRTGRRTPGPGPGRLQPVPRPRRCNRPPASPRAGNASPSLARLDAH